ncbi:hypothetical protein PLICRDRAFT_27518 [Plicaturopsis crispa FD-325 SS-3]|nr:hypothetical protein PLICRDRAFT_27518 [Plicaturopsis crispa FD-325 SS-3]
MIIIKPVQPATHSAHWDGETTTADHSPLQPAVDQRSRRNNSVECGILRSLQSAKVTAEHIWVFLRADPDGGRVLEKGLRALESRSSDSKEYDGTGLLQYVARCQPPAAVYSGILALERWAMKRRARLGEIYL